MYDIFSRCLMQFCPQTGFFLFRQYKHYEPPFPDDEFEKYEPRPKIVVDTIELDTTKCSPSDALDFEDLSSPRIRCTAQYNKLRKSIVVKIFSIAGAEYFDRDELIQVRISTSGLQRARRQTAFVHGPHPIFNEILTFSDIEEDKINRIMVKFRIYVRRGSARATLKGETQLDGQQFFMDGPLQYNLLINRIEPLKSEALPAGLSPGMHRMSSGGISNGDSRRNSMVDSSGRFCSQPNTGSSELSLGLCYDTSSECLTISVEKGASIGDLSKPPDTFVKILVKNSIGKEIHRDKTEPVKSTIEPIYNRQTAIQIHKADIETTTVIIEVWRQSGFVRAKQMVGSVALGYESSSPDAQEHWEQMIRSNGIPLSKWHPIQPSV